jgi:hypothetical protein
MSSILLHTGSKGAGSADARSSDRCEYPPPRDVTRAYLRLALAD